MSVFHAVSRSSLIDRIRAAKNAVALASPGVSREVAAELISIGQRLGLKRISVVLDPDPDVVRLGLGEMEGLLALRNAGIAVRSCPGLRLGILCVDERALVFAPVARVIETDPTAPDRPNAVELDSSEAARMIRALAPEVLPLLCAGAISAAECQPEIGVAEVSESEVRRAEKDLANRPPVTPDLARRLRILNSRFQFVEIKFKGARIGQRKIGLKGTDFGMDGKDVDAYLQGTWKLLGESVASCTEPLQRELESIRKDYLRLLPRFGQVIWQEGRSAFDGRMVTFKARVEAARTSMTKQITTALEKSRANLRELLLESYQKTPPKEIRRLPEDKVLRQKATEKLIERFLGNRFPSPADLLDQIECDWSIYNISEQIMSKAGFKEAVEEAFGIPLEDLVKREHAFGVQPLGDNEDQE